MEIQTLFREALLLPANAVGYHVNHELSGMFLNRFVLFGHEYGFELEEYVQAMECPFDADSRVFQHIETHWNGHGRGSRQTVSSAWHHVRWEGHAIEVGLLSWNDGSCEKRYHWIVSDSRELGERFLCAVCDWEAEVRGEVLVFDNGNWSKSEELYHAIKSVTFDNLTLPDALKEEIQTDFRQFFASRELYDRYRIPWKRGILFLGPPGNGKTHTVKALINQIDQPCLYVKSLKARYATDHETIHSVFERARQTTPCLLVLEDLDSLINDRNRAFFLNELDGFAANTGVVVLATTNHPELLDPAILDRPSRFDRKYAFELPAAAEREAYISRWNATVEPELQLTPDGLNDIVERTDGFSFAYLKELFLSAMMRWIAVPQPGQMDLAMRSQIDMLRDQMTRNPTPAPELPQEEADPMAAFYRGMQAADED